MAFLLCSFSYIMVAMNFCFSLMILEGQVSKEWSRHQASRLYDEGFEGGFVTDMWNLSEGGPNFI
ncbi:hypothetical protein KP509_05G071600 [Ceratopteris richardii]|uniref:Uncharacterized protein n=1 Tax=Ceratopteris richardii TaxID=49495 RepID=A0A8T2UPX0_CERRI|nr:hypothetical protein KP509_05G071600 [Ceratopteris richardii]